MTPLPPPLESAQQTITVWRLERAKHLATWQEGLGGGVVGGRWNPKGRRAIYASLDPATAILEVAAHQSFQVFSHVQYVMIRATLSESDAKKVQVVHPENLQDDSWLAPGPPIYACQKFGAQLLDEAGVFVMPSAVSRNSWNAILDPAVAKRVNATQTPFRFDPRLNSKVVA